MVGAFPASNIKTAAVYLRLIEKIRLSDEENIESKFKADGNQFSWNLPIMGYGDCEIELENDEATSLVTCIEETSPVRVSDAAWLLKIVASLKPKDESKNVDKGVVEVQTKERVNGQEMRS
jgi:hypothetical protein